MARADVVTAAKQTVVIWNLIEVGDVTNHSGLAASRELIDVTPYFSSADPLEDWARVRKPGLSENEDVTVDMNTTQDNLATFYGDLVLGVARVCQIRFPAPLSRYAEFTAYCSRVEITGEIDNIVKASVTLGITDSLIDIKDI